jgi:hypothetical protein
MALLSIRYWTSPQPFFGHLNRTKRPTNATTPTRNDVGLALRQSGV